MSRPTHRWAPPPAWASVIPIATTIPISGALQDASFVGAECVLHGTRDVVFACAWQRVFVIQSAHRRRESAP